MYGVCSASVCFAEIEKLLEEEMYSIRFIVTFFSSILFPGCIVMSLFAFFLVILTCHP